MQDKAGQWRYGWYTTVYLGIHLTGIEEGKAPSEVPVNDYQHNRIDPGSRMMKANSKDWDACGKVAIGLQSQAAGQ